MSQSATARPDAPIGASAVQPADPRGGAGWDGQHTRWGLTCQGEEAKALKARDDKLRQWLGNGRALSSEGAFDATLASLHVDYKRDARFFQLALAVDRIEESTQSVRYKFVLSATPSQEAAAPVEFLQPPNELQGSFSRSEARELWLSAVDELQRAAGTELLRQRGRFFEGFFQGDALEVEDGRLVIYEGETFQCRAKEDGPAFDCSCAPHFASLGDD